MLEILTTVKKYYFIILLLVQSGFENDLPVNVICTLMMFQHYGISIMTKSKTKYTIVLIRAQINQMQVQITSWDYSLRQSTSDK